MLFLDANFTVSCCKLQHSLSTRKDYLCMRHATPCIRPATFSSTMQLHAFSLQLFRNWIASKQLNQYNASIIKIFDFFWYQLHMSLGTTALLNSAPMHSALVVNSDPRSSIRHCHFDLIASIQLIMLLLLYGRLIARFNSWDPHHLNESYPKISS